MSEHLDARQRAMLAEMGVTLWQRQTPAPQVAPAPPIGGQAAPPNERPQQPTQSAALAPAVATRAVMSTPTRTPSQATPLAPTHRTAQSGPVADLSALDWTTLKARAMSCQDCRLCDYRQQVVWGQFMDDETPQRELEPTRLMVVADPPEEADEQAGLPFAGGTTMVGKLVHNMLSAMGVLTAEQRQHGLQGRVFVTHLTQCKVPPDSKLLADDVHACRRYLEQKIAILKPQLILTLGRTAALALLSGANENDKPAALGQLRGTVHHLGEVPWVASFAPAYLLRNPMEKSKAWADLCLALEQLEKVPNTGIENPEPD